MVPVKSSAHDMKNSYSVFERPFKLLKNDVFLFGVYIDIIHIYVFYYAY